MVRTLSIYLKAVGGLGLVGCKQRSDLVTWHSFTRQQILLEHPQRVRTILAPEDAVMNKTDTVPALAVCVF